MELLIAAVTGTIATIITQLVKKTHLPAQIWILLLSGLVCGGYVVGKTFLPEALQTSILQFSTTFFTTMQIIYVFLMKKWDSNNK